MSDNLIPVNTMGYYDEDIQQWVPLDSVAVKSSVNRFTADDIKSNFDESKNSLNTLKEYTETKLLEVSSKQQEIQNDIDKRLLNILNFAVAGEIDASLYIQRALDRAFELGGAEVFAPTGTYILKKELIIKSNTKLRIGQNTVFDKQHTDNIIVNFEKVKGAKELTGYNGHSNITIEGGTFEANGDVYKDGQGIIFAHANNVCVKNVTIKNISGGHAIELNGINAGYIENVQAYGFEGEEFRGAFQIDLDTNGTPPTLGDYGSFDGTPCKNITIKDCTVGASEKLPAWGRGIESHSSIIGRSHTNISVLNNKFHNTKNAAIRAYAWNDALIQGNEIYNCGSGIIVNPPFEDKPQDTLDIDGNQTNRSQKQYNITINANLIDGMTLSSGLLHGISIWGQSTGFLSNMIVTDNIIRNTAKGANGIYVKESEAVLIDGNIIEKTGHNGISISGSLHTKVTNNTIKECSITGIYVADGDSSKSEAPDLSTYIQVNNNHIKKAGGHGIHFSDSTTRSQIHSNMIMDAGQSEDNRYNGIYVSSLSKNISVRTNDVFSSKKKLISGLYITGTTISVVETGNFVPDDNYFNSPIVNELLGS
ncbi:right-handed parallel beta-helix repeat-containing protein [Bacillus mojavensis]|uniref:right-handed parallel beta-helix repeat-containing protein n=1 Tax=Bacillus mojavensis TaxID=72360 RepID=UPI002DB7CD18|nr:right-handed parallel beta-helix repeat-containing protein [Bacillus mojavensis]MEC1612596.1 right-handed parallel beta-helix repeat-containing protein [Bacillus mojavensis]